MNSFAKLCPKTGLAFLKSRSLEVAWRTILNKQIGVTSLVVHKHASQCDELTSGQQGLITLREVFSQGVSSEAWRVVRLAKQR